MSTVTVELDDCTYDIHIKPGLLNQCGSRLRDVLGRPARASLVTDSNVGPHYAETVLTSLREAEFDVTLCTAPAGEASKSLARVSHLYDEWLQAGLDRRSVVLALGGGMIGDLAGFAAATFLRGLAFVQLPTSLLAQVDSSVGGKTGVNLAAGKNLIGSFWHPRLVLSDTDALQSLPKRELLSGLAEVVKYGVIADAEFFAYVEDHADELLALDGAAVAHVVEQCCRLKAHVVAKDERETSGLRASLNFGHTLGHAIEAAAGYQGLLHGEAVSVGMIAAGELAVRRGLWPSEEHERMARLLDRIGLPVRASGVALEDVLSHMAADKKAIDGRPRFVLPTRLGAVKLSEDVPAELVREIVAARLDE